MYRCPICQIPLSPTVNQGLACEQNHHFDRHKKGYINLLPAQNKRSKQPGDDKTMIMGRRDFLRAGYYQPLAEKLADCILPLHGKQLLDAGCGEGYYLNHLQQSLDACQCWGFDISKPAILLASHYKDCEWAVASTAHMPYEDACFDVILSVFSRVNLQEFLRVLRPGGHIVFVGPGRNHLLKLRRTIYKEIKDYDESKQQQQFSEGLSLKEKINFSFPLYLENQQAIQQLLTMTPHGQRLNEEARQRLAALNELNDEADFRIYSYQKI